MDLSYAGSAGNGKHEQLMDSGFSHQRTQRWQHDFTNTLAVTGLHLMTPIVRSRRSPHRFRLAAAAILINMLLPPWTSWPQQAE